MNDDRWKQVDNLLQSALARPPAERAAWLHQACAGQDSLEREVLSLLASHQAAGSFLEDPAMKIAARGLAAVSGSATALGGRTISHYRIGEQLGHGGMGVVWKARDTSLDRYVAFKVLPSAKMSDPEYKRRFVQEAKAASALNHPNIVTVYEIGHADGVDFIAMEFVPGKTLDQLIQHKRLRLAEALDYAIQVADALAAAHMAGIVHRDLKPGNLMVNESGVVKVLDFGLAKPTGHADIEQTETIADTAQTATGVIVGTASFMSPEQAEGKKVDARSDIFSFGAVLYEMITGRRAFSGNSMLSILSAILRDQPKPAAETAVGLPPGIDRILTRCLRKDPNRRYQHAGDLKIDLQEVTEETAPETAAIPQTRPVKLSWFVTAAVCTAVAFWVGWWLNRPPDELTPWRLTRLTADAGLTRSPALSRDGKLVAYSSDRDLQDAGDLYVKQIGGGQPIRLTSDGAGNTQPDFSPDGTKIVFRSNRDGGGIYEIPAFGGDSRLLARDGWNPKYSPDGSHVAYWVGGANVAITVPGGGSVWVVSVSGGQPQRVGPNLTHARTPIWSPDGKYLLAQGYTSANAFDSSRLDWWLIPTGGEEAVRTGAYQMLVEAGLLPRVNINPAVPVPGCWSASTNKVIFSNAIGNATNLWQLGISARTGKVNGKPMRLTTGAGNESDPSCLATGALTFTAGERTTDMWSLPFDLDRGKATAPLERVTHAGPALREWPSLSRNGRYLAFASNQSGQTNVWLRDLMTGKESIVSGSPLQQNFPVSNAAGSRIAYGVYEKDKRVVHVAAPGGAPEKLCEGCLRATDWSRDEKTLLTFGGNPYQINLLDLASHRQTLVLKHPRYHLLYGRFSPDNHWVGFTARIEANRGRVVIAPLDGPKPVPESAWIAIGDVGIDDSPDWSPDGQTLYFTSLKDGYHCLWGQRLDAVSHRPVGEAFAVQHLHGRVSLAHYGWSAGGGRIALPLVETTGNIWMMSRSAAR
jgi:eukaryotic-like serine/threonine-protein kinase